ncbi:uncharacterized protein LOC132314310 [Cornus florida]|uniref:uncharacterized protein LOC132314310 n=1 Tax=Cornus florida TaxID=4283 RepID=UPI00289D6ADD|nr:uncharacterized protein LOC132314310 [Cornus florida]
MDQNPNPNPNPKMQDLDEAEETLSLCDLPIYRDASESENFFKEYQSSSWSSDQDYFEFFSEEWSTPTTTYPPDNNIIFCGKLIPYKQPVSIDTHKLESTNHKNPKRRGLFRWKSESLNKAKTSARGTKGPCKQKKVSKLLYVSSPSKSLSSSPVLEKYTRGSGRYGVSVRKVSVVAPPAKYRWYLFMFGLARFPTKMELGDMRNRQSRRGPSALFRLDSGGEKAGGCRRRWKGLWWGLIRAVGFGGRHHANTVV